MSLLSCGPGQFFVEHTDPVAFSTQHYPAHGYSHSHGTTILSVTRVAVRPVDFPPLPQDPEYLARSTTYSLPFLLNHDPAAAINAGNRMNYLANPHDRLGKAKGAGGPAAMAQPAADLLVADSPGRLNVQDRHSDGGRVGAQPSSGVLCQRHTSTLDLASVAPAAKLINELHDLGATRRSHRVSSTD
jgi:hypothetical protein